MTEIPENTMINTTEAGLAVAPPPVEQPSATLPERPLMELLNVSKTFTVRSGGKRLTLSAVDGVSLRVREGKTLGIVGESGCGKSTLARVITGLHSATSGEMIFDRAQIPASGKRPKEVIQQMQMVFQDPSSALNPRATVGESIAFPLRVQGMSRKDVDARVTKVISDVGLPASYSGSYPHQLSGGQRQRVNIARALALQPRMVVLDEAVSALDKSIQAQVLNLLTDLQRDYNLTYVFISHDLNVVEYISDEVVVLYLGQVVEHAPAKELWENPQHPYTKLLLSSIPSMDPDDSTRDQPLDKDSSEIPSAINPPSGCRFRTRCPMAMDICAQQAPPPIETSDGHLVACHLYTEGSQAAA
ncbi:dipeptide/oligopeptide/nickel ABC transporter ATP-binding protein [Microlunatus endophyticus]|uniref:Glutathione import ATP-binding protein GsiA n=1 Tax=Microlunatus endophyticus TaxID=1716077 RepID=A0A917SBM9_9ACTN|nr:ABC transporter ATP-binding protein [Microlunatus endophyticus]GGL69355.1 dipeptide/oligopeptide/nickel ABC transporter ATP-binding protein [Microlunatus endophyticus]